MTDDRIKRRRAHGELERRLEAYAGARLLPDPRQMARIRTAVVTEAGRTMAGPSLLPLRLLRGPTSIARAADLLANRLAPRDRCLCRGEPGRHSAGRHCLRGQPCRRTAVWRARVVGGSDASRRTGSSGGRRAGPSPVTAGRRRRCRGTGRWVGRQRGPGGISGQRRGVARDGRRQSRHPGPAGDRARAASSGAGEPAGVGAVQRSGRDPAGPRPGSARARRDP